MDVYRVSNGVSPNPGKPGSPDNFESNPELEPRIKKTGVFGFEFSLKKLFFPEFFGIFRNFSEFFRIFRKFSEIFRLVKKVLWPGYVLCSTYVQN